MTLNIQAKLAACPRPPQGFLRQPRVEAQRALEISTDLDPRLLIYTAPDTVVRSGSPGPVVLLVGLLLVVSGRLPAGLSGSVSTPQPAAANQEVAHAARRGGR
jgi:hypothetical protein